MLYLDSKTTIYLSKYTTHCAEPTSNIQFTGWIGQRHDNTVSDSCPPKLDDEMREAIKHQKFNFNIFMALLRHGIDECLPMACLGYLGSLKSK